MMHVAEESAGGSGNGPCMYVIVMLVAQCSFRSVVGECHLTVVGECHLTVVGECHLTVPMVAPTDGDTMNG